jgi:hypothetical protein
MISCLWESSKHKSVYEGKLVELAVSHTRYCKFDSLYSCSDVLDVVSKEG